LPSTFCWHQSLEDLRAARQFVPEIHVYDNSSAALPCRLVLSFRDGKSIFAADPLPTWLKPLVSE
jgi:hypothetical protein